MTLFLGIDIGSVSVKLALVDRSEELVASSQQRTNADPLGALRAGLRSLLERVDRAQIAGVGTTGSGKELAAMAVQADVTKNEISAHACAAARYLPDVRTVIEIGGQDSKIILLRDGLIEDFAMNSVCAAGTGSFLEQQAQRLNLRLDELSALALEARRHLAVAARCTVFAESDMIYKQQVGYPRAEIIYGLCLALAKNYLNTLAKGKTIEDPICFQGGVAANLGMRRAFGEVLGTKLEVPQHHVFMGAIGAALFARRQQPSYGTTGFLPELLDTPLTVDMYDCEDCENRCNVITYRRDRTPLGYRGDTCGKYSLGIEVPE